jgi:hypothetical protein
MVMTSNTVGASQALLPATEREPASFGSLASAMGSSGEKFFRRTTDTPYGERIRKLLYDCQRIARVTGTMPEVIWLDGQWWTVLPFFPTYKGVRFRIEGNRLHLLPNVKDPARD